MSSIHPSPLHLGDRSRAATKTEIALPFISILIVQMNECQQALVLILQTISRKHKTQAIAVLP